MIYLQFKKIAQNRGLLYGTPVECDNDEIKQI